HQVNLGSLAHVVHAYENDDGPFDTLAHRLVGPDQHTPMIHGLGVLGRQVRGRDPEAGMRGQRSYFPTEQELGVQFTGKFTEGTTATDLTLIVVDVLRQENVVGKFVEYFGPGLADMALADRATMSNMAPEYGATVGYFPIDQESLNYLRLTGRDEEQISIVEEYAKANGLWYSPEDPEPEYTQVIEVNLDDIVPNLAGPKRPHDRVPLSDMKTEFRKAITAPEGNHGFGLDASEFDKKVNVEVDGKEAVMQTG